MNTYNIIEQTTGLAGGSDLCVYDLIILTLASR